VSVLLGTERARVDVRPPAVDTLGDEAAALAASAGLVLEPWQVEGLRVMLSLRDDGRWAAFEYGELCPRQNGKTAMFAARALAGLFLFDEELVLWSAHEYKTAMRSFRDLRNRLRRLGEARGENLVIVDDSVPVKIINTNGEESFERVDTGQMIKMVARSKGSGRGFSADCLLVDEAFAFTEEQQDALIPTMTARPNPQVCYASSPPLSGRTGAPLFALRQRAERGGDGMLAWRDWGLKGDWGPNGEGDLDELLKLPVEERDAILNDRSLWAATNPALGRGRVTEESVLRNRRALTLSGFAREVLGVWPKQTSTGHGWEVIPEAVWTRLGTLETERPTSGIVFGADGSWPDAQSASIVVAGLLDVEVGEDQDGDPLVDERVSLQVVEHRPGTGWVVDRLREMLEAQPDALVVIDRKGPLGFLVDDVDELGYELITPSAEDVAHAYGRFVAEAGTEGRLLHYGQQELSDAVRAAGTRPIGDARTWARKGVEDISPLTAGTLAVAAALERDSEPWLITT
jgi:hypothetical protein